MEFPELPISATAVERIEGGDRAIKPLDLGAHGAKGSRQAGADPASDQEPTRSGWHPGGICLLADAFSDSSASSRNQATGLDPPGPMLGCYFELMLICNILI